LITTVKELRQRYLKVYTAAIADVLQDKGLWSQCLPAGISSIKPESRLAGPVVTIKCMPDPTRGTQFYDNVVTMADACSEGCILVIDSSGDYNQNVAHFGDVMGLLAQLKGCTGVIVDGGVRDLETLLQIGMIVFARYQTPKSSAKASKIIAQNVPIKIGNVIMNPGDFIVGDMDGLVVVPKDMVEEVLVESEEVISREKKIRQAINSGMSLKEVNEKYGGF